MADTDHPKKIWGLLTRRERWGLSWRGRLAGSAFFFLLAILWLFNVQPFLATTQRTDAKILVVEGWVHPYAIAAAMKEFNNGHYEKIYTTGGPVVGSGGYINDFNTSASVGAELLVKAGMPAETVQMVPSRISGRDRTYSSALALREWFQSHHVVAKKINVLTEDVHARRTWLLFQKALGAETVVGIVSAPSPEYEASRWWRYSEGVREVLGESIAYVYAKLFFHPRVSSEQVP